MGIFGDLIEGFGSILGSKQNNSVSIASYIQIVEVLLEEFGVDVKNSRLDLDSKNDRGWVIQKGSAQIIILISENDEDDDPTIEIFSPILKLPSQNILPFYRRCLELNWVLVGCAICVSEDKVLVRAEMPLNGLNVESIGLTILNVAGAADQLDDDLAEEFGAQLYDES
jgi:hypothetical protein